MFKRLLRIQFVRYLVVGTINAAANYSLYALLISTQIHYTVATFLVTIFAILFNFQTLRKLVFFNNNPKLFYRFMVIYGLNYLLMVGGITGLKLLGLNDYWSGAALMLPMALLGYFSKKHLVFGHL